LLESSSRLASDADCFEFPFPPGDLLFTGACGDWVAIGPNLSTNHAFGTDKAPGQYIVATQLGPARNVVVVYLDPANFKNIGDGHTVSDQINEILAAHDLGAIPASNDRIGGAQLLESPECLQILPFCRPNR
jgi:hypothetical protein